MQSVFDSSLKYFGSVIVFFSIKVAHSCIYILVSTCADAQKENRPFFELQEYRPSTGRLIFTTKYILFTPTNSNQHHLSGPRNSCYSSN